MKKIYYQVVENVLPQVYLLYNSFNNKFILLNNVRYEKYKKETINIPPTAKWLIGN